MSFNVPAAIAGVGSVDDSGHRQIHTDNDGRGY